MSFGLCNQTPVGMDLYAVSSSDILKRDGRKITGLFVDIAQQDGKLVRMWYPLENLDFVKWVGINEKMASKY